MSSISKKQRLLGKKYIKNRNIAVCVVPKDSFKKLLVKANNEKIKLTPKWNVNGKKIDKKYPVFILQGYFHMLT